MTDRFFGKRQARYFAGSLLVFVLCLLILVSIRNEDLFAQEGDYAMLPFKTIEKPMMMVMGIECRTSNDSDAGPKDIPKLWQQFYSEGVLAKIPNKASNEVIALYCDYEGDFTQPYSCVIGCSVTSIAEVPEGMVVKTVPTSQFAVFEVSGEFPKSLVDTWGLIWGSSLERSYEGDYEVYGKEFTLEPSKEMKVYVAIKG
jgi:predicted transcriptional regulator YdeE